jgi:deoxycytidylate deaminase
LKPKFTKLAQQMAEKSTFRARVGCVIVRGNTIISFGWNDGVRKDPRSNHPFHSVHAEFAAVLAAKGENLNGCSIYVCRILKSGELAMARPCEHCEAMLRKISINKVYYSISNEWKEEEYL